MALAIVICRSKLPCLTIEEYIDYIRIALRNKSSKKDENNSCRCPDVVSFWRNLFENADRENVKLRIKMMELEKESGNISLQNEDSYKNTRFSFEIPDKRFFDMEKINVLQHDSGSEKLYDSFHLFYLSCLLPTSIINTSEFRHVNIFEAFQRLCNSLTCYIMDSISMALNYRRIKTFRTILEYITYVAKFLWNDENCYIDSLSGVFDAFFELIRYQSSYYLIFSVKESSSSSLETFNNSYVDERYEIVNLVLNITNQFCTLFPIAVNLLVKHIKISYTRCADRNISLAIRNSENSACGYYLYSLSILCRKNRRIPSNNLEQLIKLVEKKSRDFRSVSSLLHSTSWFFKKRILFLVAHPDDEVMFFGPSIFQLINNNEIYLVCLSNGNAEGLGKIREKELIKSCNILGISSQNITVIDNSQLKDSMTSQWDPNFISQILLELVTIENIDIIITFDHFGISKHPNHIACYYAALLLFDSLGTQKPLLYVLTTVSILRKYLFFFDMFFTIILYLYYVLLNIGTLKLFNIKDRSGSFHFFVNSFVQVYNLQRAMIQGYSSQMKWFRWLYIFTSRYMLFNELERKR
ncbi:hypothetical protein PCANB_001775 [Pneumocystis canis]|nr:hypothetical protein PCANB_001775 [Pneumocystis canis]